MSKGSSSVWVKSKLTAPNEPWFSNQILDTHWQILWVVSFKEWNSRIKLSTKFSKFRDNQPKRHRHNFFLLFNSCRRDSIPSSSKSSEFIQINAGWTLMKHTFFTKFLSNHVAWWFLVHGLKVEYFWHLLSVIKLLQLLEMKGCAFIYFINVQSI